MSGDVTIGEGRWENVFADEIPVYNVWWTQWASAPARDFMVVKRNHFFQIDPDHPLGVVQWNTQVKLLRDLPNQGLLVGTVSVGNTILRVVRGSDGTITQWSKDTPAAAGTWPKHLGKGDYLAFLDGKLGGNIVYPLNQELDLKLAPDGRVQIFLPASAAPQKAGETRDINLLMVGVPRPAELTPHMPIQGGRIVEIFRRDMGLAPESPAYQVKAAARKVMSQQYQLHIDGQ